jgi:DNA repair protein RadD
MFSHIAQGAMSKGKRVMVLVHRERLLDQASASLKRLGVEHGLIKSGRTPDPRLPVQIAGVDTLVNRLDRYAPPDLIIVDEGHHAVAGKWKRIVAAYPKARVLGVTATPERLDGKGLGDIYDHLIRGPEVSDLIERGFLCQPVYYGPSKVDTAGLRGSGDFTRKDAEQAADKPVITGCAVSHYRKLCDGVPAVAFACSVKHAEHVASEFRAGGYNAAVIEGTQDAAVQQRLIDQLASGALQVLVSCDLISEGFDLPLVTAAILLRPTKSLSLHLQQVGRVLRTHATKTHAIILDHVGNCERLGYAEEIREWTLEGARARKKRAGADGPLYRQCPACYGMHRPAPVCALCGHVYEVKERAPEAVDGELQQLNPEGVAWKAKKRENGKAQSLPELIALGKQRGYRNPAAWAAHILRARGYGPKLETV